MELFVGILIGACLAITAVVVLGYRALRAKQQSGSDLTQVTFDPDLMLRVRALAVAGDRDQAIKVLRESTPSLGLGQASLLVDRMAKSASRRPAPGQVTPSSAEVAPGSEALPGSEFAPSGEALPGSELAPGGEGQPGSEVAPSAGAAAPHVGKIPLNWEFAPSSSAVDLEVELEVRALRADGKSAEAVRLIEKHTGWDQRSAEDYVNGL